MGREREGGKPARQTPDSYEMLLVGTSSGGVRVRFSVCLCCVCVRERLCVYFPLREVYKK